MGLFDKKYCDVCGEKIGLLGNRKLEDGNLCKDCARKLSPFFDERRHSTVEQIKQQLAYREQNKTAVAQLRPMKSYGTGMRVHVDMNQQKFVVVRGTNWKDDNPDVIDFSQVTSVNTDIKEHKKEIYYRDNQGQQRSYVPARYEFTYEFKVVILVNSPWFDDISFELSDFSHRPDSTYSPVYNDLMMQMNELSSVLMGRGMPQGGFGQPMMNQGMGQQMGYGQPQQGYGQQPMYNNQPNMGMGGVVMGGMNMGMQNNPNFNNNGAYTSYDQGYNPNMGQQPMMNQGMGQPMGMNQPQGNNVWMCSCGAQNTAAFCQNCGQKKPQQYNWDEIECDKCSWRPEPGQPVPKFCPNCGDPINWEDEN
ncbi:MAG: DUF4428 domain-containing protein [Clostridia bacterium]|nr:DUF4428 domain-containing protein [Clostridia bacterium]